MSKAIWKVRPARPPEMTMEKARETLVNWYGFCPSDVDGLIAVHQSVGSPSPQTILDAIATSGLPSTKR